MFCESHDKDILKRAKIFTFKVGCMLKVIDKGQALEEIVILLWLFTIQYFQKAAHTSYIKGYIVWKQARVMDLLQ